MSSQTVNPKIIGHDPQQPVFGAFMKLIHPFDFYGLSEHQVSKVEQVGVTGIPVQSPEGCYLSSAYIYKLNDQLYCVTTTVPAVTTTII